MTLEPRNRQPHWVQFDRPPFLLHRMAMAEWVKGCIEILEKETKYDK